MKVKEIKAIFEEHEDFFLEFDEVPQSRRRSNRPDLNAFMLLDELVPGNEDIVAGAEHDEIFIGVEIEQLAQSKVTQQDIEDLIRCGVRYDDDTDGLAMYA